jgi:hypothetical protein
MRFDSRIAPHAGPHLSDDQLLEIYVLAGEDRHLGTCRHCAGRFDELVRTLQHMHEAAVRDADTAFSAERLHDQRERIMRRIERHDHPAEVVAFPYRTATPPGVHRLLGPARRWVAGAAAAGLAAGLFLGFAMDRRIHYASMHQTLQPASATQTIAAWQIDTRDEQLLNEVEEALVGSRVREMRPDLGAIDLMTTPVEIREVSYVRE